MTEVIAIGAGILLATLLIAGVLAWREDRLKQNRIKCLIGRQTLSPSEQSLAFFGGSEQAALLWTDLASAFDPLLPTWFPSGKLRPGDRFNLEIPRIIGADRFSDDLSQDDLYQQLIQTTGWRDVGDTHRFSRLEELISDATTRGAYSFASTLELSWANTTSFVQHPNGGGYISRSATVDPEAVVEAGGVVLDCALVERNAVVMKHSSVYDFAKIMNSARISSN